MPSDSTRAKWTAKAILSAKFSWKLRQNEADDDFSASIDYFDAFGEPQIGTDSTTRKLVNRVSLTSLRFVL
jgi:hypothetical protein